MTQGASQNAVPQVVRRISTPDSSELARLAEIFGDLQFVLRCCELLVGQLALPPERSDEAAIEALWIGALVAYVRCFSGQTRGLKDADVDALELEGEVGEFHKQLRRLRDHYASRHVNPREKITIGVAQGTDGKAEGVAITSAPRPPVDEVIARQTGQLALALTRLVEERMGKLQEKVFKDAQAMSPNLLSALPLIELDQPEELPLDQGQ
jgi:hypothetical protein